MTPTLRRLTSLLAILAIVLPVSSLAFAQNVAQVRGVLLTEEGLPAVGYQVALKNDAGDLFLSPQTGKDGFFELAQLPADTYRLVAFDPKGAEFPILSKGVQLEAGQVERVEIRLAAGQAMPPGRTPLAPAASGGSGVVGWFKGLPIIAKVGIVAVGAFAIYEAVDDDDDDDPVSPSQVQ